MTESEKLGRKLQVCVLRGGRIKYVDEWRLNHGRGGENIRGTTLGAREIRDISAKGIRKIIYLGEGMEHMGGRLWDSVENEG